MFLFRVWELVTVYIKHLAWPVHHATVLANNSKTLYWTGSVQGMESTLPIYTFLNAAYFLPSCLFSPDLAVLVSLLSCFSASASICTLPNFQILPVRDTAGSAQELVAEASEHLVRWLLVERVHFPFSTWKMGGGQRVAVTSCPWHLSQWPGVMGLCQSAWWKTTILPWGSSRWCWKRRSVDRRCCR